MCVCVCVYVCVFFAATTIYILLTILTCTLGQTILLQGLAVPRPPVLRSSPRTAARHDSARLMAFCSGTLVHCLRTTTLSLLKSESFASSDPCRGTQTEHCDVTTEKQRKASKVRLLSYNVTCFITCKECEMRDRNQTYSSIPFVAQA